MKKILFISTFIISIALYSFTTINKEVKPEVVTENGSENTEEFNEIVQSQEATAIIDFDLETE